MSERKYYYGEMNEPQSHIVLKEYVHEINRFRFNWHPQIELMIVTAGCLEACVNGSVHYLEEDDVLLINSNQGHATLLKEPNTHALVIHLDPLMFDEILEDGKNLCFTCMSDSATRYNMEFTEIRRFAAEILNALMKQDSVSAYRARGFIQLLLARLLESFPPEQISSQDLLKNKKQDKVLKQILKYSEKYYDQKITMQELAALTGYNQTYLSTLFKKKTGIGYYEYLTRIRLRHGIHEMNKTSKTILDIALDAGFSDVKAFTLAFKKYFLKTPQQYRSEIQGETSPVIDELVRQYIPAADKGVSDKLEEYMRRPENKMTLTGDLQVLAKQQRYKEISGQLDSFYTTVKNILNS